MTNSYKDSTQKKKHLDRSKRDLKRNREIEEDDEEMIEEEIAEYEFKGD